MKLKTKLITLVVAFLAAISFALPSQVNAAKGDQARIGRSIREQVDDMEQIKTSS